MIFCFGRGNLKLIFWSFSVDDTVAGTRTKRGSPIRRTCPACSFTSWEAPPFPSSGSATRSPPRRRLGRSSSVSVPVSFHIKTIIRIKKIFLRCRRVANSHARELFERGQRVVRDGRRSWRRVKSQVKTKERRAKSEGRLKLKRTDLTHYRNWIDTTVLLFKKSTYTTHSGMLAP